MFLTRIGWLVSALLWYGVVLLVSTQMPDFDSSPSLWRAMHAGLYGGLALMLLAAFARSFPRANPTSWRLATLAVAALAAGAERWLVPNVMSPLSAFDAWMAALLGIAVGVMLPRWLPTSITCRWLGIERRQKSSKTS